MATLPTTDATTVRVEGLTTDATAAPTAHRLSVTAGDTADDGDARKP